MTRVINIRSGVFRPTESYVYCGRVKGAQFHYGNPFPMKDESWRDWSCDRFEQWLYGGDPRFRDMEPERRIFVIQTLFTLKGKELGCWCKPKRCHCDLYVKILEGTLPAPTFDSQNVSSNILV